MAAKHWKIRIPNRQWLSNISRRGRKPKCEKKKPKATYSVSLVMAFLGAENESRQLEDLPQADFSRVPERFLLTVRSNSITDNFVYWKLGPLFVFEVIQLMFSSWVGTGHGFEVARRAVPRSARKVSKMASKFLVWVFCAQERSLKFSLLCRRKTLRSWVAWWKVLQKKIDKLEASSQSRHDTILTKLTTLETTTSELSAGLEGMNQEMEAVKQTLQKKADIVQVELLE